MEIYGTYENVVATLDRVAALRYWGELGYSPIAEGRLEATAAHALYNVDSGLNAIRLRNGTDDTHGLLRLLLWDKPPAPGLGHTRPLSIGSRWLTSRTNDILRLRDAYLDDVAKGVRWTVSELVRQVIREGGGEVDFYQRFVGVREMLVLGQEVRHVFFQRYGYEVPGYGTIGANSPLEVSEATHGGIVVPNLDTANFYSEVLGLVQEQQSEAPNAQPNPRPDITLPGTTSFIGPLMRREGESYKFITFVTPTANVGRMYVMSPQEPTPDFRQRSRPGVIGLCLATYRVNPIIEFHQRVQASTASAVTAILPNEFGELSFSFTDPAGMAWNLVGE